MGVNDLWKFVVRDSRGLEEIVALLKGRCDFRPRIGIDVSVWIHKAFRKDALVKIAVGSGGDTSMVDADIMGRFQIVLDAGAIPVALFDGDDNQSLSVAYKTGTNHKRAENRVECRTKAIQAMKAVVVLDCWLIRRRHMTCTVCASVGHPVK